MLQQSVKHAWRVAQCARNDDAMKSSELIASGPALSVRTGTTNRRPSAEATRQRRIEELLEVLKDGDRLVVSELSRLGRSLGQVIRIVEELVRRKIHFVAIKEAIRFEGKQDMQTKVMIALFGLFAEVERDLISERTKEGLDATKAKGRVLGRPKGSLGNSKLDGLRRLHLNNND